MENKAPRRVWYKLDNAAKIYPAIRKDNWSSVFRVDAVLDAPIAAERLQRALDGVLARLPVLACRMRRGLFWYYLEENPAPARIFPDVANPCRPILGQETNGHLFRVLYYDRRVAVEVFHSLCDGSGALTFLKTLVGEYLRLGGESVTYAEGVLDVSEPPRPEEAEDAFARFAGGRASESMRTSRAFRVKGVKEPPEILHVTTGLLSVREVLAKTKALGVSLTEYLAAVLAWVFYQMQRQGRNTDPIRILVPVNLRGYMPSETVRNFAHLIRPGFDPKLGTYTFEEVLQQMHHQMRLELTGKSMRAKINTNVRFERNPVARVAPLFVKNLGMGIAYKIMGDTRASATLSNLGNVRLPPGVAEHVQRVQVMLGPAHINPVNCTMASCGDVLDICMTSTLAEREAERRFFTFLVRQGLHVKIESNEVEG